MFYLTKLRLAQSILLSLAFLVSAVGQSGHEFFIKSDHLGESLDAFKGRYKNAHCSEQSENVVSCLVYDGVTLGGYNLVGASVCEDVFQSKVKADTSTLKLCGLGGLGASFTGGKMTSFMLALETFGHAGTEELIGLFEKKYGPPTDTGYVNGSRAKLRSRALWDNGNSTMQVISSGCGDNPCTRVLLSSTDAASKDF